MTPASIPLRVIQGTTLNKFLRLMQPGRVYKEISAIAAAAPVLITVTGHGLTGTWPVWFRGVTGLNGINREPDSTRPWMAEVVDADTLRINAIDATGQRGQGGRLIYLPPVDLTGVTGRLQVRAAVGSSDVLLESARQSAQADAASLAEAQATIGQLQAQIAELTKPAESTVPERIASRRYQAQVSGTTLEGMQIDTSTDSQALITGAALAAVLDSNYVCRWKMADGTRVELDAKMIIAVASAVRDHIQACYDREDELLTAVADGTFSEAMLDQGWPA